MNISGCHGVAYFWPPQRPLHLIDGAAPEFQSSGVLGFRGSGAPEVQKGSLKFHLIIFQLNAADGQGAWNSRNNQAKRKA